MVVLCPADDNPPQYLFLMTFNNKFCRVNPIILLKISLISVDYSVDYWTALSACWQSGSLSTVLYFGLRSRQKWFLQLCNPSPHPRLLEAGRPHSVKVRMSIPPHFTVSVRSAGGWQELPVINPVRTCALIAPPPGDQTSESGGWNLRELRWGSPPRNLARR